MHARGLAFIEFARGECKLYLAAGGGLYSAWAILAAKRRGTGES